jgi:hypothetical protein
MAHPLKKPERPVIVPREAPTPPKWPSFQGASQFVGMSPSGKVTIWVDLSLGDPALQNANDLVNDADGIVQFNDKTFGTPAGHTDVIIFALNGMTDGTGGADHLGCDFTTGAAIEVCAAFGQRARVSALFEAELSECSMGGNLCGYSTGEALSRWCAAWASSNALGDFATAPTWAMDGMPDYVNHTDQSDQHPDSTGCGMAFLSWLQSKGYGIEKIAPAMVSLGDGGTLAQLDASLTGDPASNAWTNFQNAIRQIGGASAITNDDPFGAMTKPAQLPFIAPWAAELSGKIYAAILADVAAGKTENQIMASVRAVLVSAPGARKPVSLAAPRARSHPLRPPGMAA